MNDDRQSIADLLGLLVRKAPVIVAVTLLAGAATYAYSSGQTEEFAASVHVELRDVSHDSVFREQTPIRDPERVRQTQLEILQSRQLTDEVTGDLGDAGEHILSFGARGIGATDIIEVTAVATTPEAARDAAQLLAEKYVADLTDQTVSSLEERTAQLRERIDEISTSLAEIQQQLGGETTPARQQALITDRDALALQRSELSRLADQFEIESALRQRPARITESAELPVTPVAPRPARDAVLAAFVALVLVSGLVVLRARLDDRVRTADDVRAVDPSLRVLASIPSIASFETATPPPELVEAFRDLRSNVAAFTQDEGNREILIMSPDSGSGKTTATALLGRVLAAMGRRVILVDGDLRRSTLHGHFGIDDEHGLTTTLAARRPLLDALVDVPLSEHTTLELLPVGPAPTNPADVVASDPFQSMLELVRRRADVVLVDSPPTGPVSDAYVLVRHADGVILLARHGRTRRSALSRTLDGLRASNANVLGVVLTFVPKSMIDNRYYGSTNTDLVGQADIEAALTVRPASGMRARTRIGSRRADEPEAGNPN